MSANVSVGYTPQTTDIFVCRRHVGNVVPTRRRHSVMSANFLAVGVVSVRPIADTHSYMYVGISIDEVVTTYEDKKNWHPLRFCIHSQVLTQGCDFFERVHMYACTHFNLFRIFRPCVSLCEVLFFGWVSLLSTCPHKTCFFCACTRVYIRK